MKGEREERGMQEVGLEVGKIHTGGEDQKSLGGMQMYGKRGMLQAGGNRRAFHIAY